MSMGRRAASLKVEDVEPVEEMNVVDEEPEPTSRQRIDFDEMRDPNIIVTRPFKR